MGGSRRGDGRWGVAPAMQNVFHACEARSCMQVLLPGKCRWCAPHLQRREHTRTHAHTRYARDASPPPRPRAPAACPCLTCARAPPGPRRSTRSAQRAATAGGGGGCGRGVAWAEDIRRKANKINEGAGVRVVSGIRSGERVCVCVCGGGGGRAGGRWQGTRARPRPHASNTHRTRMRRSTTQRQHTRARGQPCAGSSNTLDSSLFQLTMTALGTMMRCGP